MCLTSALIILQAYNGERRVVGVKSREVVLNAGKPWHSSTADACAPSVGHVMSSHAAYVS